MSKTRQQSDDALAPQLGGDYQKNPELQVLADISTSLSMDVDVEHLLDSFLGTMVRLSNAHAGIVRVLTSDGKGLRIIGAEGLPQEVLAEHSVMPLETALCGQPIGASIKNLPYLFECKGNIAQAFGMEDGWVVALPLRYKNTLLGVYNLFLKKNQAIPEDVSLLFASISEHLGMALENARLTRENLRITLMNERQMLANEIHDSLAQTLAYMKMRLAMLREAVEGSKPELTEKYLSDVDHALESAYSGLRELISQFRHRMDPRGIIPALQELLEGVTRKIDVQIKLDNQIKDLALTPDQEVQVYRIAQEALANICKHSYARKVQLLLEDTGTHYRISIIDDGIGLYAAGHTGPGMHFGMNIMRERAERIKGMVEIRSRVGGGTRVTLVFPHSAQGIPL
jgi:two-component system, NarL family, nitrate/nitrite sensor histidine kinase NarX